MYKRQDEDFIERVFEATNHNYMLFFTEQGRCYWLRVFEIPEGSKNSKGRAIQNLLNLGPDNRVQAIIRVTKLKDSEYNESHNIVFATKNGVVKKTALKEYSRPRTNGVIAINLLENDQLIDAVLTEGDSEIILANKNGRAIRFNENQVRNMGRPSTGVKGMTLDGPEDGIVGMICMRTGANDNVLVVSEKGMGKRSELDDYRITHRGGKGVKTMNITDKTGKLIAIKNVNDDNDLVIINKSGIMIRMKVTDLRVMGRNTQGVRLINLEKKNDEIASVCKVQTQPEVDEDINIDDIENNVPEVDNETENNNTDNNE